MGNELRFNPTEIVPKELLNESWGYCVVTSSFAVRVRASIENNDSLKPQCPFPVIYSIFMGSIKTS